MLMHSPWRMHFFYVPGIRIKSLYDVVNNIAAVTRASWVPVAAF
jgi:hypothetical protein